MNTIQQTHTLPLSYPKLIGGALAIAVLATLTCLFSSQIGTFFHQHRTFSTLLIPTAIGGVLFAGFLDRLTTEQKKVAFAALLVATLGAYAFAGGIKGFSEVHHWMEVSPFRGAVSAFAVGFSAYLIFNTQKRFKEKEGTLSTEGFSYGKGYTQAPEEWQPIYCKSKKTYPCAAQQKWRALEEAQGRPFQEKQLILIESQGKTSCEEIFSIKRDAEGKILEVTTHVRKKNWVAATSQRREIVDKEGKPTGKYHLLLYEKKGIIPCGGLIEAGFGFALRSLMGIIWSVVRLPLWFLFLLFYRIPKDLTDEKTRSLEIFATRIVQLHKVVGESLKNIIKHVVFLVPALLGLLAYGIEKKDKRRPYNALRFLNALEEEWNGVPMRSTWWSTEGAQPDCLFEGNIPMKEGLLEGLKNMNWDQIDPDKSNLWGFTLMGCCHPKHVGTFDENGKLLSIRYLGSKNVSTEQEQHGTCPQPFDVRTYLKDPNLTRIKKDDLF